MSDMQILVDKSIELLALAGDVPPAEGLVAATRAVGYLMLAKLVAGSNDDRGCGKDHVLGVPCTECNSPRS